MRLQSGTFMGKAIKLLLLKIRSSTFEGKNTKLKIWCFWKTNAIQLRYCKNATLWTHGLVVRALDSQSRGTRSKPMEGCFKTTGT